MKYFITIVSLALAACGAVPPTANNPDIDVSQSSDSSEVAEESSSSSEPVKAVPLEEALDMSFLSPTLGIAFRYPSTYYMSDCLTSVPVEAIEREGAIDFMLKQVVDTRCTTVSADHAEEFGMSALIATLYAERATDEDGVRHFIDRVFPHDCVITERSGDRLFLDSKVPPTDAPDFDCGESIQWNQEAGVVYFSSLGSKNGGGIEWPAAFPIADPSGYEEQAYDFFIMHSVTFPKS